MVHSKGCSPQQPDEGCLRESKGTREAVVVGRYLVGNEIGAGGMATVHVGRLLGPGGFARTVAIKRLREELARDREFVQMFLDEARIAARVQHANVGQTLDVVAMPNEVILVMEYVHGESLGGLRRAAATRDDLVPAAIASSMMLGALRGLHAAHESRGEHGEPIDLVHRDVSPENVIVGTDGVAKVLDFGIVIAADRVHFTTTRLIKGKLGYMSPEQTLGERLDRRSDIFAAGIVLWETLSGVRLFRVRDMRKTIEATRSQPVPRLSTIVPDVSPELDEVLARALAKDPDDRFQSAEEMAEALESAIAPASAREVGEWVEEQARDVLAERELAIVALHGSGPKARAGVVSKTKILAARASTSPEAPRAPEPPTSSIEIEPEAIYVVPDVGEDGSGERRLSDVPRRTPSSTPQPIEVLQSTMVLPNAPVRAPATVRPMGERRAPSPASIPPPPSSRPTLGPMMLAPSAPHPSLTIPAALASATPIVLVESRWSAAVRIVTLLSLGASIMIVVMASFPGRSPVSPPPAAAPLPPVAHVSATPSPPAPPSAVMNVAPPKMRAPIPPRYPRSTRASKARPVPPDLDER